MKSINKYNCERSQATISQSDEAMNEGKTFRHSNIKIPIELQILITATYELFLCVQCKIVNI